MFGTGLLKGMGVTAKHLANTFADDRKAIPSRYKESIRLGGNRHIIKQPLDQEGLLTIQYPEEKRLLPERFRYIPMLIWDTQNGIDKCTACGICAKVCPPQCIWIVRDTNEKGKPVTRPREFYIDAAVCMSCSFCVEFCPFDAIKMNHDYELAVYDRYPHLVYDKAELTVPVEYYAALWPVQFAAEETERLRKEEVERAKEEAKRAKAAEATRATSARRSGRSLADLQALKEKAAKAAAARKRSDEQAVEAGEDPGVSERRARLERLKRQAAERARQRREQRAKDS